MTVAELITLLAGQDLGALVKYTGADIDAKQFQFEAPVVADVVMATDKATWSEVTASDFAKLKRNGEGAIEKTGAQEVQVHKMNDGTVRYFVRIADNGGAPLAKMAEEA